MWGGNLVVSDPVPFPVIGISMQLNVQEKDSLHSGEKVVSFDLVPARPVLRFLGEEAAKQVLGIWVNLVFWLERELIKPCARRRFDSVLGVGAERHLTLNQNSAKCAH